jgi:ribosome-associated toxin RatA of RatAB toxin-antitoxin module
LAAIKKNAVVPYTPSQMYALVDDIEAYPLFLPWCKNSTVIYRSEDEVSATLTLAKGGIEKSFSTINRLQKNKMIEVTLKEGPFKHLEGFWLFESIHDNCCKVTLDLEFELANNLFSLALGPIFQQIANTLVDAFCERAKDLYE